MLDIFLAYDNSDEYWRLRFDDVFGRLFKCHQISPMELQTETGEDYVERLTTSGMLNRETVMVVLIGPKAFASKKLDWEISAALKKKGGRPTGLVPVRLPNHEDHGKKTVSPKRFPIRIVDNLHSGFLKLYDWTESSKELQSRLYAAEKDSRTKPNKADNSRSLMKRDMFL